MSHQAYSWVLDEGPALETVDRHGSRYGPRARAMRAVMCSIANAANAQGENSHPGLATMIHESLYTRAHVLRIVDKLVEEHWLEITEEGRGRGHATVYRLLMDRVKVSPCDLSEEGNGLISGEERSHLEAEKVSSEDPAPYSPTDSTESSTAEAERLCRLLADLMVGNGCKPPNITKTWVDDIDRMMRLDGRTPSEVENCIRWCQADSFWQANILSPKKLRAKYDQLRLAAKRAGATPATARSAERDRRQDLLFDEIRRHEEETG